MSEPSAVLIAVYERDNGRCRLCDRELKLKVKDCRISYALPLDQGGLEDLYNMQLCCESCEKQRGRMSNLEYEKHLYARNRKAWESYRRAQGRPRSTGSSLPVGWQRR